MDDDLPGLADRLCTGAGMMMEDHNMLVIGTSASAEARVEKLAILQTSAEDMLSLIVAAKVLPATAAIRIR